MAGTRTVFDAARGLDEAVIRLWRRYGTIARGPRMVSGAAGATGSIDGRLRRRVGEFSFAVDVRVAVEF
jgi:hypothetical protein